MSKRTKLQPWTIGDVFLVRTLDGLNVVGQILGREAGVLNSVSCAFFDFRFTNENKIKEIQVLPFEKAFSILFVTRDLLDNGQWRIVSQLPVTVPKDKLPYEHLRKNGYIGAKVIGSGIVNEFLSAFYGLSAWDDWKDPTYLDKLLISPEKKPATLKLKSSISPD
jgi:hypothetical protein